MSDHSASSKTTAYRHQPRTTYKKREATPYAYASDYFTYPTYDHMHQPVATYKKREAAPYPYPDSLTYPTYDGVHPEEITYKRREAESYPSDFSTSAAYDRVYQSIATYKKREAQPLGYWHATSAYGSRKNPVYGAKFVSPYSGYTTQRHAYKKREAQPYPNLSDYLAYPDQVYQPESAYEKREAAPYPFDSFDNAAYEQVYQPFTTYKKREAEPFGYSHATSAYGSQKNPVYGAKFVSPYSGYTTQSHAYKKREAEPYPYPSDYLTFPTYSQVYQPENAYKKREAEPSMPEYHPFNKIKTDKKAEVEENNEIDSAPRGNNSGSRPRILFNSPFWTGVQIKFKREAHPPFPVYNDDNDYGEGKIERAVRGYRNIENRSGRTCNCESE